MPELVPTVADAETKSDIVEIGWELFPEHILEALDLLMVHLCIHEKLVRKPVYARPKLHTGKILDPVPMRRAIPNKAISAAARILWVGRSYAPQDGMAYWHVDNWGTWKQRLILAGIDQKTCEVDNHRRWAFCYMQLTEERNPHFSQTRQVKLIDSNLPTPDLVPKVHQRKVLTNKAKTRIKKKLNDKAKCEQQEQEERGFTMHNLGTVSSVTDRFGRRIDY
ncbi:MAG TPA: hypothetical protein VK673_21975 [Chthoniobacterales bacterium]|nr:hypothetical protein [Chthoniobacterales bacterium]